MTELLPALPAEMDAEMVFIGSQMVNHLAGVQAGYAPALVERLARGESIVSVLGDPVYVTLRDEMIASGAMPKSRLPRWPMRGWE